MFCITESTVWEVDTCQSWLRLYIQHWLPTESQLPRQSMSSRLSPLLYLFGPRNSKILKDEDLQHPEHWSWPAEACVPGAAHGGGQGHLWLQHSGRKCHPPLLLITPTPSLPRGRCQHMVINHLLQPSIGPIRAKQLTQSSSVIGWQGSCTVQLETVQS